jgi:hypothetical protein
MNNFLSPKQLKIIFIGGAMLFVITIIAWIFSPNTIPQISHTTPLDGSKNVPIYTEIIYSFEKEISTQDVSFIFIPDIAVSVTQKSPTIIALTPKRTLQPATTYTIVPTWHEKKLPPLTFTTQATQTDPILIENMKTELERDYPLGQKLPLNRPGFRVVYSAPMTLEITLKNTLATQAEVIDEVKLWVTQNGGDVNTHKYVIASPSPALTN